MTQSQNLIIWPICVLYPPNKHGYVNMEMLTMLLSSCKLAFDQYITQHP